MLRSLPGPVSGIHAAVRVPTSKSLTNRALIATAAADGGRILRPLDCEDTRLLASAIEQAGWPVAWGADIVIGARRVTESTKVDLGNSGTGSRLILALLACVPGRFRVDGTSRLRERPMAPLIDALRELGSTIDSRDGYLPAEIQGGCLAGGRLRIRPEVSSQFVSALLLAAPLMTDGLDLEVIGPVPSRPYLDLTREVLKFFGASVTMESDSHWRVGPGGLQRLDYTVEGDWSAVAFAAAAVAVAGGEVRIGPLAPTSAQGDRVVCEILADAGLVVDFKGEELVVRGSASRPFKANLSDAPDLFPALSVVAAAGPAGTLLDGLDHLQHKESDRLAVMTDNLRRLGAEIESGPSFFKVTRSIDRLPIGKLAVTAAGDHRIAMAMAVAGLVRGDLEIDDDSCVAKSFPEFWEMWDQLLEGAVSPP